MTRIRYKFNNVTNYYESKPFLTNKGLVTVVLQAEADPELQYLPWYGHVKNQDFVVTFQAANFNQLKKKAKEELINLGVEFQPEVRKTAEALLNQHNSSSDNE